MRICFNVNRSTWIWPRIRLRGTSEFRCELWREHMKECSCNLRERGITSHWRIGTLRKYNYKQHTMKTTDLKIGDIVQIKLPLPKGDRISIPMQVVGIFSQLSGISPKDTVYLDFEGNEGDIWEEEVQNLVFANSDKEKSGNWIAYSDITVHRHRPTIVHIRKIVGWNCCKATKS